MEDLSLILVCSMYTIWIMRNKLIFDSPKPISQVVASRTKLVVDYAGVAEKVQPKPKTRKEVVWTPPHSGLIVVNVDAVVKNG